MNKIDKAIFLEKLQNNMVTIIDLRPTKYGITYPGIIYPKPRFLVDGKEVKIGNFFSQVMNDDAVEIDYKIKLKK